MGGGPIKKKLAPHGQILPHRGRRAKKPKESREETRGDKRRQEPERGKRSKQGVKRGKTGVASEGSKKRGKSQGAIRVKKISWRTSWEKEGNRKLGGGGVSKITEHQIPALQGFKTGGGGGTKKPEYYGRLVPDAERSLFGETALQRQEQKGRQNSMRGKGGRPVEGTWKDHCNVGRRIGI